ncbi:MAG: hypothetical protein HWQ35_10775 [Nostoc sp. NMS1]|uniref:hypothetical protein n=1 Tax=unclassified Nostoc TaxID=2593658 RepID=UPI0025F71F2D|nr:MULTISPECIES: hypothetical protein [unclassified Nostoc]MBN3907015.1 hypothetical protein [Nostoc sp. NMS1]MBN3992059.1 hypothetical protein [Nostoc sp. NMS2]
MTHKLPQNQAVIAQALVIFTPCDSSFLKNQLLKFWLNNRNFGLIYQFISLFSRKLIANSPQNWHYQILTEQASFIAKENC